jgi:hypothetical protein
VELGHSQTPVIPANAGTHFDLEPALQLADKNYRNSLDMLAQAISTREWGERLDHFGIDVYYLPKREKH